LSSNDFRLALSPLSLGNPIAQSSPLGVALSSPSRSKLITLDAVAIPCGALTDVPAATGDAREVKLQSLLDRFLPTDLLHRKPESISRCLTPAVLIWTSPAIHCFSRPQRLEIKRLKANAF
jgi:hypothetical protein